jgi:hypothetical protein
MVSWRVEFSEPVTGVGVSDFSLAGGGFAGGSIHAVSGSGKVYNVTANNVFGPGTLGLNLIDNDSIHDIAYNPLGGAGNNNGNFTGHFYYVSDAVNKIIYVDYSNLGMETGTSEFPFNTLSEAIDFAQEGDYIIIRQGIYPENIQISKKVTIRGENGSAIIGGM